MDRRYDVILFGPEGADRTEIKEKLNAQTVKPEKTVDVFMGTYEGNAYAEGLQKTEAPFVLFLSAEAAVMSDRMAEILLSSMENEKIFVSYGRQIADAKTKKALGAMNAFFFPDGSEEKSEKNLYKLGMKAFFVSNRCAMYRRDILEALPGFEINGISHPEYVMAANALHEGYVIRYEKNAEITVHLEESPVKTFRNAFDFGVAQKMFVQVFGMGFTMLYIVDDVHGYPVIEKTTKDIYCDQKNYAVKLLRKEKSYLSVPGVRLRYLMKRLGNLTGKRYHRLPVKLNRMLSGKPEFFTL